MQYTLACDPSSFYLCFSGRIFFVSHTYKCPVRTPGPWRIHFYLKHFNLIISAKFNMIFFNLRKKVQNYTLKTTKCHWEKLKASKNWEIYHVHGSDDSIALRCQLSLNWSRAFWLLLDCFTLACVKVDMWILTLP